MILPIHHADLDEAARLITTLRSDMNGRAVCTAKEMRAVLERSLDTLAYEGFLAREPNGLAVGYIGVNDRFAIYAGGHFAQITELFVDPEARRRGVGQSLIRAAEAYARGRGARHVELGAPGIESHPGTHAFYEAQGYRVAGPRLSKPLV